MYNEQEVRMMAECEKVEAIRWKVLEGKTVELYYDDSVYRRVDALLIENKSEQKDKVIEITSKGKPKYPPLVKRGTFLTDPVAIGIFEKNRFKVRSGVVDGLKDFISTGFRTKEQVVEWFEIVLGLKHCSALIYMARYIFYLETNNKIETQVIAGQDAFRLRENVVRAETPTI